MIKNQDLLSKLEKNSSHSRLIILQQQADYGSKTRPIKKPVV